ncbi:MAG: hypothetical protein AB7O67_08230 [Vicinamibacterales bacterium]
MRSVLQTVFAACLVAVPATATAPQDTPNTSWTRLAAQAQVGQKLVITIAGPVDVEGRLLSIDTGSIVLEQADTRRSIAADNVLRVRRAGVRRRHVIIGALIGWATGAVGAALIDRRSSHPSSTGEAAGLGGLFIGLPAGAIVGALMPTGPPLYEATSAAALP